MAKQVVFEADSTSVTYGGVHAVSDVSLTIEAGQIVGLIGPNGAGKTSFIDGVSGFARMSGNLRLAGERLNGLRAHRRNSKGLSRTWQSVSLFEDLTVAENVKVASRRIGGRGAAPIDTSDPVAGALERLGIGDLANKLPGELSHGQRVLVGVARAIVNDPLLVLMDEPGAGLDDQEGAQLGRFLRQLADSGTAILLVDHDMGLVLKVCDRISVLDFGRKIAEGTPSEIAADPTVVAAYLGTATAEHDDSEQEAS